MDGLASGEPLSSSQVIGLCDQITLTSKCILMRWSETKLLQASQWSGESFGEAGALESANRDLIKGRSKAAFSSSAENNITKGIYKINCLW